MWVIVSGMESEMQMVTFKDKGVFFCVASFCRFRMVWSCCDWCLVVIIGMIDSSGKHSGMNTVK